MIVAFIGKPGAGKDTVCRVLSQKNNWKLIVTGDLLRKEIEKGTPLGKIIAPILAKGEIVKDEIVAEIIYNALKTKTSEVVLLNGYPRTVNQAKILEEKFNQKIDMVIEIVVSDKTVFERLTLRRYCPKCGKIYNLKFLPPKKDELCDNCGEKLIQRNDDKEEVVKYRLKRFYDEIEQIREFYKKRNAFFEINGERKIEEVVKEIENLIKKKRI